MKYIKALIICIIFALMLIFVWQNKEILGFNLVLKLDFGLLKIPQFQMPVYLAIPLAFLLGAMVTIIYGVFYNSKLYGRVREQKRQIKTLEKQVPPEVLSPVEAEKGEVKKEAEEEAFKSPSY